MGQPGKERQCAQEPQDSRTPVWVPGQFDAKLNRNGQKANRAYTNDHKNGEKSRDVMWSRCNEWLSLTTLWKRRIEPLTGPDK